MRDERLAVIVPMFNESANAERCVTRITDELASRVPDAMLVVVDDGSTDGTGAILEAAVKKRPFLVEHHGMNRGYGAALVTGARAARRAKFEYGLFMDADLTNDPALIPAFAEKLLDGRYDLVKASRYVNGGGMSGVPAWRRAFTIVGNQIASRLFGMGIKDCTNGFRAVRLSLICDEEFEEKGFPQILEELLVLKRKRAQATEIPYVLTARGRGGGTSKFTYSPRVLYKYLRYAVKAALV